MFSPTRLPLSNMLAMLAMGLGTEAEGPIAELDNKKFENLGISFFVKFVTPEGKLLRKGKLVLCHASEVFIRIASEFCFDVPPTRYPDPGPSEYRKSPSSTSSI